MSLIALALAAGIWEVLFYKAIARFFSPSVLIQWAAHVSIRSGLGLLGYALFQNETIRYGAMAFFHGVWVGWPLTSLVLAAFLAMLSGVVFVVVTLPLLLVYLLVRAMRRGSQNLL